MKKSNYDKFPEIKVSGHSCVVSWEAIAQTLQPQLADKAVIAVDCYHGVDTVNVLTSLEEKLQPSAVFDASAAFKSEGQINELVKEYVTDDPVFGYIAPLHLTDFFDAQKLAAMREEIEKVPNGLVLVVGVGAGLVYPNPDVLVYADMPRWEIQLRFRRDKVGSLGVFNETESFSYLYKRAFFVDWRVCDRHKKTLMDSWDFLLDTTNPDTPKLITGTAFKEALLQTISQPFRVVPFFDPGPWGGQWLKEVIDLDRSEQNFAWGFDCVPEENSLLYRFGENVVEVPSLDLVFAHPRELLGAEVFETFGDEFPIRFDFLDTMEGGNLSLQVHPLTEYIQEKFGMPYTQDESYYMLEAKEDAFVYLGMKDNVVPEKMLHELEAAQTHGHYFEAENHVEKWPIKKHDHVLIPAGTVHCSGANSVVLEISATPYIFTFKLWDWGRMGLDGKPRPISLEHGKNVIQWDRTTQWTQQNIINKVELVAEEDGWREERTGLHEGSFIETRRHWFSKAVPHHTNGVVNVLNLIEGAEAIVESPSNAFAPFVIHYAETFIVPAAVGAYTIRPYGAGEGKECATLKAYVRTPLHFNAKYSITKN
ncbi:MULTISPECIES: class I mannose-6-phosphate isomerase [Rufibacter]|uniref:Mannose-6-phosphate isomerase class I n=1 Tax=Rufibacter quisquiliarum TaxID=1549639 RepID=A0A839GP25_9BACT|nr:MULTISPECIES: class I mannose-6-phosphate isomerase [Rufibacter]MBA9077285.1 mannose-6-phosphate isomerase class I [Rufibacter quisquiliarum]